MAPASSCDGCEDTPSRAVMAGERKQIRPFLRRHRGTQPPRLTRMHACLLRLESQEQRERVCCLLVLNLVSSTLSCIRQPRPLLRMQASAGLNWNARAELTVAQQKLGSVRMKLTFATNCEDTPSRHHATTTLYNPSSPRRTTTHVKTLRSPIALYSKSLNCNLGVFDLLSNKTSMSPLFHWRGHISRLMATSD
jgi:hypothetical protein